MKKETIGQKQDMKAQAKNILMTETVINTEKRIISEKQLLTEEEGKIFVSHCV